MLSGVRRLASIVAMDVVGYSRLVGSNEDETITALRALRRDVLMPLIEAHGGRVANTAGDSLLLDFPSVVEAISCAVAMQQAVDMATRNLPASRRILFRIGVNIGDVIRDGQDLLGDAVNIAARLEALADPGGVMISDEAWRQVGDRLDLVLQDQGSLALKNITRPVRAWRWKGTVETTVPATASRRPRIAVLSFENRSGDQDQEFLADGISEDIISGLSLMRHLSVVSRTATFALKGRSKDARTLAAEFDADYVVSGSVRRSGARLRVTAQLENARSGDMVWSERFDVEAEDVFDMQDAVIGKVAGALGAQLTSAEFARAWRITPNALTTWEAVQRALAIYSADAMNPSVLPGLIGDLRDAVAREPDYAYGHSVLAWTIISAISSGQSHDIKADIAEAIEHLHKGMKLGPGDPLNLFYCGCAWLHHGRSSEAIELFQRSLRLNENNADVHLYLGVAYAYAGDFEKAEASMDVAEAMAPSGGFALAHQFFRSKVKFVAGDFDAALQLGRSFLMSQPDFGAAHVFAALGHKCLGDDAAAAASMVKALRAEPHLRFETLAPYVAAHPDIEEAKRRFGLLREIWPISAVS